MGYNEIMSRAVEITGTQLTSALRALDVNFIMGGQSTNETLHKRPTRLIASLAESGESRLRFNAITLPQSGSGKNTDNPDRCQTTFQKN